MKRLVAPLVLLAGLALPAAAFAGATVTGATHAVARSVDAYVAEEGGTVYYYGTPQVTCHRTAASKFTCHFSVLKRIPPDPYTGAEWERTAAGHVTVTYSHRRYHVGELHYEQLPY
jgi:hypothetical protein